MAIRPGQIRYLTKGKLLGAKSHAGFVDTFNWMLSWIYNFSVGPGLDLTGKTEGKPELNLSAVNEDGAPIDGGGEDTPETPEGGVPETTTEDVVTGVSFAWVNGQLKATVTKKTLTVIASDTESPGTSETKEIPLWQQDVDSDLTYDTGTKKLTKRTVPGVRTSAPETVSPTEVFTAVSHDTAYGGS
jgi:hypothetical protein